MPDQKPIEIIPTRPLKAEFRINGMTVWEADLHLPCQDNEPAKRVMGLCLAVMRSALETGKLAVDMGTQLTNTLTNLARLRDHITGEAVKAGGSDWPSQS